MSKKSFLMSEKKIDINKYHKRVHEYIPYGGEIPSSGLRYIELVQDKEMNLYVKKRIKYMSEPSPNHFFNREVSCLAKAQSKALPFVPLIEFEYPTKEAEGYIITQYMEGGNVMKQILSRNKNENEDNMYQEDSSIDLINSDSLPHIAFSYDYVPVEKIDLNPTRKMIIVYGTAKAISFLHGQIPSIFHRDIKPENILLDKNGEPHLSDFGISREISTKEKMSGVKGTTPYMAPELIRDEAVDISADIYSFGVTMIMIFAEKLTITENNCHYDFYALKPKTKNLYVSRGVKYDIPNDIPIPMRTLIEKCCDLNPSGRPKIDEVLSELENSQITSLFGPEYKDYINKFRK